MRVRVRAGFTLFELLVSAAILSVLSVAVVLYVSRIHREVGARSARIALEAEADRVHEWLARDAALGERAWVADDRLTLTIDLLGEGSATYRLDGATLTRFGPVGTTPGAATLVLSTHVRRWELREVSRTIDTQLLLEQPEHSEVLRHVSQMAVPLAFPGGRAP